MSLNWAGTYQQRWACVVFTNFDPLFLVFHGDSWFRDLICHSGLPN